MIAKTIRGDDFYGLLTYLRTNRNLHPHAIRWSENLLSLETAAREMTVVARGNRRCVQPVRHIILGWHEDERPSIEQQHACAEALLSRLGVASHQSVRVVHTEDKTTAQASGDGRHYELHIAVNGVGPSGKAPESTRDWSTIEIATAWIAAEHGFAEIPGRFNGVGKGPQSNRNGKARSVAAQTGVETIADEISADPDRLQRLMNARRRSSETRSWDVLLQELDRQGLRLERGKDRGPTRVRGLILVDKNEPKRRQKLSALDTPDLKWGEGALVRDFGELPANFSVPVAAAVGGEEEPRQTRDEPASEALDARDFSKELERRMRRERSVLHAEFEAWKDRTARERESILTTKQSAWRKFQARRAELLAAARTRRNFLYKLFPRHKLVRTLLNAVFDRTLDASIQTARAVFESEKGAALPEVQRWATWSAKPLKAARERVEADLRAEIDAQKAEQEQQRGLQAKRAELERQRHLAGNRDEIGKLWEISPTVGSIQITIRWNSSQRPAETVVSVQLVSELRTAGVGVEGVPGDEIVRVSVDDLANWIGTGRDRLDRLELVERAAISSRREADAARADQEEKRRSAAARAEMAAAADRTTSSTVQSSQPAPERPLFNKIGSSLWDNERSVASPPRSPASDREVRAVSSSPHASAHPAFAKSPRAIPAALPPSHPVQAASKSDHAATEENHRSEDDRRAMEAARADEEAKAERAKRADTWAARWIGAAPKSHTDTGRLVWVVSPSPMRLSEPLQALTNFLGKHPELELVDRPLAAGYREISVDAAAMTRLLTRIAPGDRDIWDQVGIACLNAHQANLVKQQEEVEARAWASAWIAPAPRSILTLGHLTWTLSGNVQEDAVFGKLSGLMNRHSTMDIRLNQQERELAVPIEPLRAVLESVAPEHRTQWDRLRLECADVSRANDDRLYRRFEESFRSQEGVRAKYDQSERPAIASTSTDLSGDREKVAIDQPPTPNTSPPSSMQSSANSDALPVGTGFAAEMLAHSKFPPLRYDQSGTAWIVTGEAVWNGAASVSSDAGAHGLGPAFERIGVNWVAQTYPANQQLTIYQAKFRDVAEALGQMHPDAFEKWLLSIRRATVSSDNYIRAARKTGTSTVEPAKRAVVAEQSVNQRSGRKPDGGIGS